MDTEISRNMPPVYYHCYCPGGGALHFVTGENYQGPFPIFVNGYMIDILLPMVLVLLMGLIENRLIRSARFCAAAVFGFGCSASIAVFRSSFLSVEHFDLLMLGPTQAV